MTPGRFQIIGDLIVSRADRLDFVQRRTDRIMENLLQAAALGVIVSMMYRVKVEVTEIRIAAMFACSAF